MSRTPSYEYEVLHQFEAIFRDGEHKTQAATRDYQRVWENVINNPPEDGVTPVVVYRMNGRTCAAIAGLDDLVDNEECAMEIARLAARVAELEAEVAVLSGTACAEEQAEGNGPCGACRTCRNKRIAELEAENAKLRACVEAADDFVETVIAIETSQAMHRVYSVALAHGAPYNGMDWSKQLSTYRAARAEVKP